MIRADLTELFVRDLTVLRNEIAAYGDESKMWSVTGDMPNSAGNLCLHLIGNINHFFGAMIAGNGFIRDREAEFASSGVSRDSMLRSIDEAVDVLKSALAGLDDSALTNRFPVEHRNREVTVLQMLLHLLTHLNYHLGQINYHRRTFDSRG